MQSRQVREFHFKLLHNIIPLNVLFKCKIIDSENCFVCKLVVETPVYFFFDCDITEQLYADVY